MMPRQIQDANKFLTIAEHASTCRVSRSPKDVKLKLRTKKMLYTYITDPATADAMIKKLTCEIIEM